MSTSTLDTQIKHITKTFEEDLAKAGKTGDFDTLYLKYFSKAQGITTKLLKVMPSLSIEDKQKYGTELNNLQNIQKAQIETAKAEYKKHKFDSADIDLTLPEKGFSAGYMHPTNQLIGQMNDFFRYYGFSVADDREIENAEYNFRKLNLPEGHPATDLQDTLFLNEPDILLRTHTSSVESRILTTNKPPIRVVVPGRVYRNETSNKSNNSFFYQYQGVVVDKGITIRHLKAMVELFIKYLFGEDSKVRFRYKYYPEVSPGAGADFMCTFCKGAGCEICKHRGWIEALGCGMIHYNTLKMCGIDPEVYTGFAWGMGLDRLVMAKYGIDDIRKLYGNGMVYL